MSAIHPSAAAAMPTPLARDVRTISVVSIAHSGSHFCQLMLPPLFPWIAPAFGLSNTQLGLLMSVFFVVSGFGQAFAGFVVDRHGPERVLFAGLALLGLAALGLGASPNYATLLVFMAVAGLGNCVFHPVDFSILNARVHNTRLGHAYAVHGISGSLGWALAPVFVVGIAAMSSWRTALFVVAGAVAALLVLMLWQRESLGMPQVATAKAAPMKSLNAGEGGNANAAANRSASAPVASGLDDSKSSMAKVCNKTKTKAPKKAPMGCLVPPSTAITSTLMSQPVPTDPGVIKPLYQTSSTPPTPASRPDTA